MGKSFLLKLMVLSIGVSCLTSSDAFAAAGATGRSAAPATRPAEVAVERRILDQVSKAIDALDSTIKPQIEALRAQKGAEFIKVIKAAMDSKSANETLEKAIEREYRKYLVAARSQSVVNKDSQDTEYQEVIKKLKITHEGTQSAIRDVMELNPEYAKIIKQVAALEDSTTLTAQAKLIVEKAKRSMELETIAVNGEKFTFLEILMLMAGPLREQALSASTEKMPNSEQTLKQAYEAVIQGVSNQLKAGETNGAKILAEALNEFNRVFRPNGPLLTLEDLLRCLRSLKKA